MAFRNALLKRDSIKNITSTFLALSVLFAGAENLSAQVSESRVKRLEKRVEDLTDANRKLVDEILDIRSEQGDTTHVNAFDAVKLDFGGFITQQFTYNHAGDFSSEASFDQTNLELLIGADVSEKDRIFAALGYLRQHDFIGEHAVDDVDTRDFASAANRNPGILVWWRHDLEDDLDVTVGRFVNPWGIINVEHFPPVLMNLNQPLFLRPFDENTIVPNFINGIQLHGLVGAGDGDAEYFAYGGNFSGQPNDFLFGGRVQLGFGEGSYVAGASFQNGVREIDGVGDERYNAFGLDLLYEIDSFGLKTEFVNNFLSDKGDERAFYLQPFFSHGDYIVFYRFDYLDLDADTDTARDQIEHVIGSNYFIHENIRLRLEYSFRINDLEKDAEGDDRDFNQLQSSVTVSF